MIPTVPLVEAAIGLLLIGIGVVWIAATNRRARIGESS